MKKVIVLLLSIVCHLSVWGAEPVQMFVFATPIEKGKRELVKGSDIFNSQEEALFFQSIGISVYNRWIQNLQDQDFVIHLLKGNDLDRSFELLQSKIHQNDPIASRINEFYNVVLRLDPSDPGFALDVKDLTRLLQVEMEGVFTKEYCFIYPILKDKKEMLRRMFQEESEYWSEQVQEIYRYRGISKQKLWVQEERDASFLVIYQEISGSVADARKKYLNSKQDEFAKKRAMEFSEVTGLSYEDLLPKLESLFDAEILD
ncbi:MAG: hypothetical protein JSR57_10575 [Verrucomicrobia bacterium]|nr:hypothetical protein [Verrucomicrobiota bacterium]